MSNTNKIFSILAIVSAVALLGAAIISVESIAYALTQSSTQTSTQSTTQTPGGSIFSSNFQSLLQQNCVYFTFSCG